jgi:kynurenine formamidase
MAEHGGTHIDAPFHFYEDGWTVDRIPPHNLIDVAATVIDVSGAVNSAIVPGHFELEVSHVIDHEKRTGKVVPFGGIVLVHTGWSRYWPDKIKYLGWSNETDVPTLNFPGMYCNEL